MWSHVIGPLATQVFVLTLSLLLLELLALYSKLRDKDEQLRKLEEDLRLKSLALEERTEELRLSESRMELLKEEMQNLKESAKEAVVKSVLMDEIAGKGELGMSADIVEWLSNQVAESKNRNIQVRLEGQRLLNSKLFN